MLIELIPLLAAGLAGGVAMVIAQFVGRTLGGGRTFDAAEFWSALLGLRGATAGFGGLVVHFLVSVGVAAGYAIGFAVAGVVDAGWVWGLVSGIIHWVAAGSVVAVVPGGSAETRSISPGPFGRQLGPNAGLAFLAAHLLFGLVAGFVYLLVHSSGGLDAAL